MDVFSNDTHANHELDLSNASRGVWLVKVPKYIANKWDKGPGNVEVGKLHITKKPGHRAQVKLSLSESILCLKEDSDQELPKDHKFDVSNVNRQTLGVYSQSINTESKLADTGGISLEGRIVQKLDCRPFADQNYYSLKSETIKKASIPQRKVKQLAGILPTYRLTSKPTFRIKQDEEGKKFRADKEIVLNMLFAAFEKHQYYNIKDLHVITKQPMGYLKEVLKEICNYNLKNPHKYKWELKPEYRHYN